MGSAGSTWARNFMLRSRQFNRTETTAGTPAWCRNAAAASPPSPPPAIATRVTVRALAERPASGALREDTRPCQRPVT